jgi:hypothetical protein
VQHRIVRIDGEELARFLARPVVATPTPHEVLVRGFHPTLPRSWLVQSSPLFKQLHHAPGNRNGSSHPRKIALTLPP